MSRFNLNQTILFVLVALAPTTFWIQSFEDFEFVKAQLLYSCALFFLVRWSLQLIYVESNPIEKLESCFSEIKKDPIAIGFLLYGLSATLSTVTSISVRTSLLGNILCNSGLLVILSYVVLFFAFRSEFQSASLDETIISSIVPAILTACGYAILQVTKYDPISWVGHLLEREALRPGGTAGHPNFLSAYLAMTFPFLGYFTFQSLQKRSYFASIIFLGVIGVAGSTLLLAGSRAGWLALIGETVIISFGISRMGKKKLALAFLFPIGIAACIFLVFKIFFSTSVASDPNSIWSNLSERMQALFKLDMRYFYWLGGWEIFKRYPIFGSGLDTFQTAYTYVRLPEYWAKEFGGVPHRAHNEFVHTLATMGSVGVTSVLFLTWGLAKSAKKKWKNTESHHRPLLLCLIASIFGFYIQDLAGFTVVSTGSFFVFVAALLSSFPAPTINSPADSFSNLGIEQKVSFNFQYQLRLWILLAFLAMILILNFWPFDFRVALIFGIFIGTLIIALLGLIAFDAHNLGIAFFKDSKLILRSVFGFTIICASLFFCIRGIGTSFIASILANSAQGDLSKDVYKAVQGFEDAVTMNRSEPHYAFLVGYAAREYAHASGDKKLKEEYLRLASKAFEHTVKLFPAEPANHHNLAMTLEELRREFSLSEEQKKRIEKEFDLATTLDPTNPVYASDAVNFAIHIEDFKLARHFLDPNLKKFPTYKPFWYQDGFLLMKENKFQEAAQSFYKALNTKSPLVKFEWQFPEAIAISASKELEIALRNGITASHSSHFYGPAY